MVSSSEPMERILRISVERVNREEVYKILLSLLFERKEITLRIAIKIRSKNPITMSTDEVTIDVLYVLVFLVS